MRPTTWLLAVYALGCASALPPEWVTRGSGAFERVAGRPAFFGLGHSDEADPERARRSAERAARRDLRRVVGVYCYEGLRLKDAALSAVATAESEADAAALERVIAGTYEALLAAARPSGEWHDRDAGRIYVAVGLPLRAVLERFAAEPGLPEGLARHVSARGLEVFRQLQAEQTRGHKE